MDKPLSKSNESAVMSNFCVILSSGQMQVFTLLFVVLASANLRSESSSIWICYNCKLFSCFLLYCFFYRLKLTGIHVLSKLNTDALTWNTSLRITEYGKSIETNSGWNTLSTLVGDTPTPLLSDMQYESSIQSVIESGTRSDLVIKPSSLLEKLFFI